MGASKALGLFSWLPRGHVKDPGSALTHGIGFVVAALATAPLVTHAYLAGASVAGLASIAVFMASMMALYAASTIYHTFDIDDPGAKVLKRLDHLMIFVLIAGTYTPFCVIAIPHPYGTALLVAAWAIAAIGMVVKFFWIHCPKWFSSVLYVCMGWICIFALPQIFASMSLATFLWLLAGGLVYSVGAVIYALKLKAFNSRHAYFGSHEVFHLFVMAGSLCQYIAVWLLF